MKSQTMSEETTTQEELLEFVAVWDDFVEQLVAARAEVKEREDELEKNSALLTRVDLTDLNEARNRCLKLEGACEALDIVRTKVIGEESRIQRTD